MKDLEGGSLHFCMYLIYVCHFICFCIIYFAVWFWFFCLPIKQKTPNRHMRTHRPAGVASQVYRSGSSCCGFRTPRMGETFVRMAQWRVEEDGWRDGRCWKGTKPQNWNLQNVSLGKGTYEHVLHQNLHWGLCKNALDAHFEWEIGPDGHVGFVTLDEVIQSASSWALEEYQQHPVTRR